MIELVFSFILNAWTGLDEVHFWAGEHFGGSESLALEMKREAQVLCALEHQGLLVYDGSWKKKNSLHIPKDCRKGVFAVDLPAVLEFLEFRSETLSPLPKHSAWDQKVEVRGKDLPAFTVFLRQDKKYVGVHSTGGWAIWIERKTGHLRFEKMDKKGKSHFRMKAHADINPLHGNLTAIHDVHALHVGQLNGELNKAYIISGSRRNGFNHLVWQKEGDEWKKRLHKCQGAKSCKASQIQDDEKKLKTFADTSSEKYVDFIQNGRALAFDKVRSEELVPSTALFR